MNSLFAVARQLQDFCEARDWRFCFIGGIAVQRWAEPRVTDDADLTLLTGFGGEEKFVDEMTIVRQGEGALDWTYIEKNLLPLVELKGKPETLEQLNDLRRSLREL